MKVNIGPYPKDHSKKSRKIDVRIDEYDTWNMDQTLSLIILPMLKEIKRQKMGVPGELVNIDHHEMKDWDTPEWKAIDKKSTKDAIKVWNDILTKMIWSFGQIANSYSKEPDIGNGMEEFKDYHKRVQDGCDLFGKWFQALWT